MTRKRFVEHSFGWCLMKKVERAEGDADALSDLCRRGISKIYACRHCKPMLSSAERNEGKKRRSKLAEILPEKKVSTRRILRPYIKGKFRKNSGMKGIWIVGREGLEIFSTDGTGKSGAFAAFLFESMEEGSRSMNMGKVHGGLIVSPSGKVYLADAGYAIVMCWSDRTMPIGMLRKTTLEIAEEVEDHGL